MDQNKILSNFEREFIHLTRRITQLTSLIPIIENDGGLITHSLECLQDGFLNIKIGPEVIMPYLLKEIREKNAALQIFNKKMDALLKIMSETHDVESEANAECALTNQISEGHSDE